MTTEEPLSNGVGSVAEVESVALWLGSSDRPLFARLDLPTDGLVAAVAILCPTLGLESEYSARALGDLAHRLASSRWAVLRVDYAGTGDSAGTWTDRDLVAEWLRGIRGAIEYARALGAERVSVVGLRIGATLAAAELARGGSVDDLVLWDPCATGKAFLREQSALSAFGRDPVAEGGIPRTGEERTVEAPGVVFSAGTVSDLEPIAISPSDRSSAFRELVLVRQGRKPPRLLRERLAQPHVESMEVYGQEALLTDTAVTPGTTLDRIVSWLTEPAGSMVKLELPERQPVAVLRPKGRPGVIERPVEIGPARLFGMLSEPEHDADPSAPTVVFLNVGRIGHHGPAGLWVDLARSLATGGLRCLRVDLSGIGDSPTRPGRTELVVFPADALEDLEDIRRAVTAEWGSELVVVGLCSGADHAIEAALAGPVASVCVVNPALSYARWGQDLPRQYEPKEGSPGLGDHQAWGTTRPWVSRSMKRLARYRRATRFIPNSGWWIVNRWFLTSSPVRTLERLTQSGVDVLVVVGGEEARAIYRGEKRRLRALVRQGRVRMEIVPGLDHSLFERTGRDRVSDLLNAYLLGGVTGAGGPGQLDAAPAAGSQSGS